MIFDIFSLFSLLVLILPLTALAAPAGPASELEDRADKGRSYKVTVGANGKYRYNPEYVYAKPGDYIKFEFYPKNHTVTESSFNYPCRQLGRLFDTGYVPVPEHSNSSSSVRTYRVKDKKPHWFYCKQYGHCRQGMVFAVNPPKKGNTFQKFQEKAMHSGY